MMDDANAAWTALKDHLNSEVWTELEEINFRGFFVHGWSAHRKSPDPLLKEIVGAIEGYLKAVDSDTYDFITTPFYRVAVERVVKKYHEQVGE